MSSLVKQLAILYSYRKFLISGKTVAGSYVHLMAIYVLKAEKWLMAPSLPGFSSVLPEICLHHILLIGHIGITKSDFSGQFWLQNLIKLWVKHTRLFALDFSIFLF